MNDKKQKVIEFTKNVNIITYVLHYSISYSVIIYTK
jgi:hypothetical protein